MRRRIIGKWSLLATSYYKTMEFGGTEEIFIDYHSYNMGLWRKSEQISFVDEIESFLSTEAPNA